MASALPRFTGPAQARQRMRLAAALGMLAIAAITTGGLASLTAGQPVLRRAHEPQPTPAPSLKVQNPLDPGNLVEDRVDEAEHAMARARAAIRSARQLGIVDGRELDALEQRLDVAAGTAAPRGASTSPRSGSQAPAETLDPQPRPL